jgi:hypothetical protein
LQGFFIVYPRFDIPLPNKTNFFCPCPIYLPSKNSVELLRKISLEEVEQVIMDYGERGELVKMRLSPMKMN